MKQEKEKNFVSCVIYLHNDGNRIKDFLFDVVSCFDENFENYEIICVNDGCTDDTIDQIYEYMSETTSSPYISLINLSFFQGVEAAMNAGRDLAVGDFVFEFDSCLMDYEVSLIMQIYHRALEDNDIVVATPKHYVPFSSKLFYMLYNWGSRYKVRLRQERFRVISRRAINRVNQLNSYIPYRKALYANSGLKVDVIDYDNKQMPERNYSNVEWKNRSSLAFNTIIIFTNVLERISTILSVIFLFIMIFLAYYFISSYFGKVKPVEGWLSTVGLLSIGFFMQFVMLTFIFKYLSVILDMIFRKQRYVVEGVKKITK